MPEPTDADPWQSAESREPLRERVLTYLREHPESAFAVRELSDGVFGVPLNNDPDDEQPPDETGEADDSPAVGLVADLVTTARVQVVLDTLYAEGEVELRVAPAEETSTVAEDGHETLATAVRR